MQPTHYKNIHYFSDIVQCKPLLVRRFISLLVDMKVYDQFIKNLNLGYEDKDYAFHRSNELYKLLEYGFKFDKVPKNEIWHTLNKKWHVLYRDLSNCIARF